MAKLTSDAVADALALLAASYERDGCPIQAIHCLQALVNRQLPPDFEAKARLHLGRLLLEHTYNFKEALALLLRAQMLARNLIGNYSMKFEIQDQLAACYNFLGDNAMELQAYTVIAEPPKAARSSSEWPAVCAWVCRLAQRSAALHARCGRADEAAAAAREGLAFAEAHGLTQQKLVFLLILLQLALTRWDHTAADGLMAALRDALAAEAAGSSTGGAGAGGLDAASRPYVLLHFNLLQVLYLLRLGKVMEVVKAEPPPPPQQQQQAPDPDGPDVPPPPVLELLETCLGQIKAVAAAQPPPPSQQLAAEGKPQPYNLPGLASLEPLVCLVGAVALRCGSSRPRLVEAYLQRGLACSAELLAASGVEAEGGDTGEESALPRRTVEAVRGALQLRGLLLQCRAQIALCKAQLSSAREDVLRCQQLQERFPGLMAPLLPGVRLLTGQYCVATGEAAAAAAHFKFARLHAPSRPAAALGAVLEAQVHLSTPGQQQQQQQQQNPSQAVAAEAPVGDVTRALAALGAFYAVQDGAPAAGAGGMGSLGAGGGGGGPCEPLGRQAPLGHLEESACLLASASCLAAQGETAAATQMLTRALKVSFKRLGHVQLTCAILNQLAPLYLPAALPGAQRSANTHPAHEAAKSSITLSQTAGDLWAEAQGKRVMSAIAAAHGDNGRAAAEAASAARRQQRIAAATAEALADAGRHGYAAGWGLRAVVG